MRNPTRGLLNSIEQILLGQIISLSHSHHITKMASNVLLLSGFIEVIRKLPGYQAIFWSKNNQGTQTYAAALLLNFVYIPFSDLHFLNMAIKTLPQKSKDKVLPFKSLILITWLLIITSSLDTNWPEITLEFFLDMQSKMI